MLFFSKRKAVVGFVLTIAIGLAIGAATLIVSNEIIKDKKEKLSPLLQADGPTSSQAVKKAYDDYVKAYNEYRQAIDKKKPNIEKYMHSFDEAKRNLEIEIFRNTPGVSEMDLKKLISDDDDDD